MRILMDYRCSECDKVSDRLLEAGTQSCECSFCGGKANKIIGLPTVMLDGTDPTLPGAYDKWARTREQNARVKSKRSYHGE